MRFLKGMRKSGQSGQSLVILAIGFLALLGFVGIVTDVSVLFIRYNTMRRAVDAAAIAAAGQMRRVADPTPADTNADDEAISVANLNLAARQFIEVYGLNPKSVLVETCRVQNVARDASGNPLDAAGHALFNTDGSENYNDGTTPPEPDADPEVIKSYRQLCTTDELKLVRVTAQIDAPTIFLRLLGYPTVTLTESAISQTAVIDVVLVFDVSESMLNETTYDDWDTLDHPQGVRYMPPYIDRADVWDTVDDPLTVDCDETRTNPWTYMNDHTMAEIAPYISTSVVQDPCGPGHLVSAWDLFRDRTIAFEPCPVDPITCPNGFKEWTFDHLADPTGTPPDNTPLSDQNRAQPRTFCQVRAYPSSSTLGKAPVPTELRQDYYDFFTSTNGVNLWLDTHPTETYSQQFLGNDGGSPPTSAASFSGFVPMYNSFACCNDPNGDFLFDDLVCQPFRDARDAAHEFLDRLDFLRGDRVAYVTFNRRAYVVDPDGADIYDSSGTLVTPGGPQAAMIETQNNLEDPDNPGTLLRKGAVETLDDVVGVLAEPSNYVDTDNNGLWDHLWDGTSAIGLARTYDLGSDPLNYYSGVDIGEITNHPVNGACPFDRAVLTTPYLSSQSKLLPDGVTERPLSDALLDQVITVPDWYYGAPYNGTLARFRNYENRSSCAGTNIGGALAASSAALFTEGRREGAVWIMVLLSDGAAGASNPVYKIDGTDIAPTNPYAVDAGGYLEPVDGIGGPLCTDPSSPNYPCPNNSTGGYGFFGLCPYGTSSQPSELLNSSSFPSCSDLQPQTRHYCGQVAYIPDTALDPQAPQPPFDPAGCINYYDVDDYARDWADWVAVADLPNAVSGGTTGRVGDQLLPTIFTIGFGLNYYNGQEVGGVQVDCAGNADCIRGLAAGSPDNSGLQRLRNGDYLGEELLRYIADVGDNFEIDNDYWTLHASSALLYPGGPSNTCTGGVTDRLGNCIDLSSPEWGTFGACEVEAASHTGSWNPKAPLESCGNYYVAASGQQLEDVFNQIASRMFTRLSQ